jgi:hypothetical protein
MVETIPPARPTVETVRSLAALHGLRFDEPRLSELADLMATIRAELDALAEELEWVEPAVTFQLRPEKDDGQQPGS